LGKLELCGLEVRCVIGDRAEERVREQTLLVDVSLDVDVSAVAKSDALADTVDYAAVADAVRASLRSGKFKMLESAAVCVADVCRGMPGVLGVKVRVEKQGGVQGLRAAAVSLDSSREHSTAIECSRPLSIKRGSENEHA